MSDQQMSHDELWNEVEPVMHEVQRLILTAPADERQRLYLALSVASFAVGTCGACLQHVDGAYRDLPRSSLYAEAIKLMDVVTDKIRAQEVH